MLDGFYVNAVLPARDGDRARAFYRDLLGLKLLSGPTDDPMVFEAGGGTGVVVSEIPERTPPPYPMVSFLVSDIERLVEGLKAKGVAFEDLGASDASFRGREGVAAGEVVDFGAAKSAWFKDTEGNILALNEVVA